MMEDTRPSLIRAKTSKQVISWPYIGQLLIFGVVYFVVARLGYLVPYDGQIATLVWPATGLSLAILLLFGIRYWPGITLGAALLALSNRHSLPLLIGVVIAHTVEPLLGTYLLRRYTRFHNSLENINDVLALVIIGVLLSTLLSASIGAFAFRVSPEGANKMLLYVWWEWWIGHTTSIVSITPFVLTWYANRRLNWTWQKQLEAALALTGLVIVSALVFVRLPAVGNYPLGHVVFPFLLWFALRFGPREVATASLVTLSIAVWGTVTGSGPFARSVPDLNLLLLLTFVLAVILTALIISSVLAQLRHAREALQQNNAQLEANVAARTEQLSQANLQLRQKIVERDLMHRELAQARDQALDVLRLKSQILANISHDARTPKCDFAAN
ncbi:MAG: MASE1 domain-containing protein [Anaerolineae bacterium]